MCSTEVDTWKANVFVTRPTHAHSSTAGGSPHDAVFLDAGDKDTYSVPVDAVPSNTYISVLVHLVVCGLTAVCHTAYTHSPEYRCFSSI